MQNVSNPAAADRYRARFRRVLDFIDVHIEEALDVERLAGVAGFSKYHFHRQFAAYCGMGAYRYIQLLRLRRASYQLAFRERIPIIDIAMTSGYEGPEAFARAFRKSAGQSPSEFRRQPRWDLWHRTYQPLTELRMRHMKPQHRIDQVSIIDCDAVKVAVLEHRGDLASLGDSIRRFIEWRRQNRLPPPVSATFNVFYDDPQVECRCDLCAATDSEIADNEYGVIAKIIPAGRCAVLRHVGSDDTLEETIGYLYSEWLPQSAQELRDFPVYCQRVRFFPEVPAHEAITDVFLPLK